MPDSTHPTGLASVWPAHPGLCNRAQATGKRRGAHGVGRGALAISMAVGRYLTPLLPKFSPYQRPMRRCVALRGQWPGSGLCDALQCSSRPCNAQRYAPLLRQLHPTFIQLLSYERRQSWARQQRSKPYASNLNTRLCGCMRIRRLTQAPRIREYDCDAAYPSLRLPHGSRLDGSQVQYEPFAHPRGLPQRTECQHRPMSLFSFATGQLHRP